MFEYNGFIIPVEFWEDIYPIFPVKEYYMISSIGRVFNKDTGKYLKPQINKKGYGYVTLRTQDNQYSHYFIHRLVMACFHHIDNFSEFDVNHKDGNKLMNYDGNLEWCTGKENMEHASATGLLEYGEDHHASIFTNEQVLYISSLLMTYTPYREIERLFIEKYNYSPPNFMNNIYRIHRKERWGNVTENYNFPKYINKNSPIGDNEAEIICRCIDNGIESYNLILEKCGYNLNTIDPGRLASLKSTISNIKKGKTFKHISSKYNFIKVQRLSSLGGVGLK